MIRTNRPLFKGGITDKKAMIRTNQQLFKGGI
jgi:hypothetical protein